MHTTDDKKTVDFSEMERHVLDRMEDSGEPYFDNVKISADTPEGYFYEFPLSAWAESILDDPNEMLSYLGFNSGDYASYIQAYYGDK